MNKKKKIAIAIAAMLISSYSSAQVTDEQVKEFFAGNPTPEQIADQAAALGMNQSQISAAMGVGNYLGSQSERDSAINAWVGNQNNGFVWSQNGALTQGSGVAGDIAAARAAARGNASRGIAPAWAKGTQQICPDGMGIGVNSIGSPKCFGSPSASFPRGEAPLNSTAVQATPSSGSRQILTDPTAALANRNTQSQGYNPNTQGVGGGSGIGDYTPEQVAQWMQGKTPDQVAAMAASLNLNPGQVQQAYSLVGQNVSTTDINNYATSHHYKVDPTTGRFAFPTQAAADAFTSSNIATGGGPFASGLNGWIANRPVYLGNATSPTDPSQQLSVSQIKEWFAANPNPTMDQMGQMASRYHMTPENVAAALTIGTGAAYNPQAVRDALNSQSTYLIENDGMISAPGHRSNGYNGSAGSNQPFAQYGTNGKGYDQSLGQGMGGALAPVPLGSGGQ